MADDEEFPIPLSWRDHFGEETFYDIFVYTHYGDRTPLEALGILGLEAPPEKRMEPTPEGLKPSEEKIKVKTPEICIKQDTNEEVKMEKETNWYEKEGMAPNLPETQGIGQMPEGEGWEEIRILRYRPDLEGVESQPQPHPGFENFLIKELPRFLIDKFQTAAENGLLPQTYRHYLKEFKRAKVFDEKTVKAFEKFAPEVEKATSWQEQVQLFEDSMKKYIGKLAMAKREVF